MRAPSGAAGGMLGERDRWTSRNGDLLQVPAGDESDESAVRRPERVRRAVGSGQPSRLLRTERPNVQGARAGFGSRKTPGRIYRHESDGAAVRRQAERAVNARDTEALRVAGSVNVIGAAIGDGRIADHAAKPIVDQGNHHRRRCRHSSTRDRVSATSRSPPPQRRRPGHRPHRLFPDARRRCPAVDASIPSRGSGAADDECSAALSPAARSSPGRVRESPRCNRIPSCPETPCGR